MGLIDEADARDREFQAAIHGIDLSSNQNRSQPASSSSTGGGLDAFYREHWDSVFSKVVI